MREQRSAAAVVLDAVKGGAAGALATVLMTRVTTFMYEREDQAARKREDAVRGDKSSFATAATRLFGLFGRKLGNEQAEKVGSALHWGLAVGGGALFGVLRRRVPALDAGAGLLFGTLFFLVMDEGVNSAFGFTPPPQAFPWQAHARGLVGHLAYGLGTGVQLRAVDKFLH